MDVNFKDRVLVDTPLTLILLTILLIRSFVCRITNIMSDRFTIVPEVTTTIHPNTYPIVGLHRVNGCKNGHHLTSHSVSIFPTRSNTFYRS